MKVTTIRIPFKKSQDDNPFFEKEEREKEDERVTQTFMRINKEKKKGEGNPMSYFRAVLSPPAKLNLFGRKRRKFEEESGEGCEKARRGGICRIVDSQPRNPASLSILFLFEEEELIVNREQAARFLNTFSASSVQIKSEENSNNK